MLDHDQIDTVARDEILSAWAEAVAAVSPHLPGGHPMPVDRIGMARRIAQRLGCTAERVHEVVGVADG
ncbi:hypothetical protein EBL87_16225 [Cereibacter sphaeroides]|uniref:hypothetical protein n=1 Tax=Cereibacter sphaeroides TaxID=1063 RepID=UPI000F540A88|nr:hypothetical protein [Cereibacter sphaeroides]AZB65309.1 hypothetical protein EBL87_16225 [Cereibacter sphaeroides]AZB70149.1 hypothetical protein EBL86_17250 [Cereibacter sphaeroides]